jgi:hypothetical protein
MSIEETLICDRCSRLIDGGSREQLRTTLREQGGAVFGWSPSQEWVAIGMHAALTWHDLERHLCPQCVGESPKGGTFADGAAFPPPRPVASEPNC